MTNTELAAYAASHPYPTTQPVQDLKVAALVSSDRATIRIYNFSDHPLGGINVWINGAYVIRVRGLTANGSVVIKTSDLYNAFGKTFASQNEPVSRVQLQAETGFYNVMGPVSQ